MKPPEQVKSNLVRQERVRGAHDRHPRRARREDEPLAEDVRDAAPQQQEASEDEGVGRHDPLQARGGDVQVAGNGGEEDDGCLDGEGLISLGPRRGREADGERRTFMKLAPAVVATMAMQRPLEKGRGGGAVESVSASSSGWLGAGPSWVPVSGLERPGAPPAAGFSDTSGMVLFSAPIEQNDY